MATPTAYRSVLFFPVFLTFLLFSFCLLSGCTSVKPNEPVPSQASQPNYVSAVNRLGLTELAQTFSTKETLALNSDLDFSQQPLLEQALTGQVLAELQARAVLKLLNAPLANSQALADFVSQYQLVDSAYLGDLSEPSLYSRINSTWHSRSQVAPSEFTLALRALISQELANGYNIATSAWPKFAPEASLVYGHNDIGHAQQLLLLAYGAGLNAKIGYSSKTSAYLHRDGWGEPPESAVKLEDGRFLIETQEYDLHLLFNNIEDKSAFMALVHEHAKKHDQQTNPLILGAWWQPFVRSFTKFNEFVEVSQVNITQNNETAQILLKPEQASQLSNQIQAHFTDWEVRVTPVWVNPAFYRYLEGSYQ